MFTNNHSIVSIVPTLVYITLSTLLSACGGQAYQQIPNSPIITNTTNTPVSPTSPQTSNDEEQQSLSSTSPPIIQNSFKLQSKASTTGCSNPTPPGVNVGTFTVPNINTDNLLKVTVSAKSPSAGPCSTSTWYYSCAQFTVTVGSHSEEVTVSYGDPTKGTCSGKPNSQTIDFSDQATQGHGALSVTVTQPKIDNCRTFWGWADVLGYVLATPTGTNTQWISPGMGVSFGGCQMSIAYDNYIVAGSLGIQTNTP